jgi:hypothetical protein
MEIIERVDVLVSETDRRTTVSLNGSRGTATVGGEGHDGYLFVRDENGREHLRLDGRAGSILAGGDGASGRIFLRSTVSASDQVRMSLDGSTGNIRAGGNGCDGDLLLFPDDANDIQQTDDATVWLDSRYGNLALGGNERDGDVLLFPRGATISSTDTAQANLWLDGEHGDIRLSGGLIPMTEPSPDRAMPEYSTNEGAVSSFEGTSRFGVIEFVHEHPAAAGDREKLRNIHVFHPLLHDNSIVHATSHAGGACVPTISYNSRPDASGGEGRFIDFHLVRKLAPGNRVRLIYWIMN